MSTSYRTYASLDPTPVTTNSPVLRRENRTLQGCPAIERTASGRLWVSWLTGGTTECAENHIVLVYSDDDGATWSDSVAAVAPVHHCVMAFDGNLWVSPDGHLYWFWAQSSAPSCFRLYEPWPDGICGVSYSVLTNPDAPQGQFRFSPSTRIANGTMNNKPTVLKDGTWCLPISVWTGDWPQHPHLGVKQGCFMIVSSDDGKSFATRGRIEMANSNFTPTFEEHMFLELADGRIKCFMRVKEGVAEAVSSDQGATWSKPVLSTVIRGANARFVIRKLRSGRWLMVNHDMSNAAEHSQERTRLTAYLSEDEGKTWSFQLALDARTEVSYPSVCEGDNGFIYIAYDRLRIRGGYIYLARITEADIMAGVLTNPRSQVKMEIDHAAPVGMPYSMDGYRPADARPAAGRDQTEADV